MAKQKIIQFGHQTLRSTATPIKIDKITANQKLYDDLRNSIPEHGIGLAAPQINVSKRVFLANIYKQDWRDSNDELVICINPKIISQSGIQSDDWEGCLSAPGFWGMVTRPNRVTVEYYNEQAELITADLVGVGSRVFQHELDHLDGVLYVDRMTDMTTLITDEEFEKLNARENN